MTNQEFIESVSLPNEEWRDVVGYEGHYSISSFGRLVCHERYITAKNGHKHYLKRCLIKVKQNDTYPSAALYLNGKRKVFYIHRLVAMMFIPNPENKPCVDHIDCNIHNNNITNLRWVTQQENVHNPLTRIHAKEKFVPLFNELNGRSTPIIRISLSNKEELKIYPSQCEAKRDGYNQGAISACCRGKLKSYKGFYWMYLSDYENLINKSKNSLPNPS